MTGDQVRFAVSLEPAACDGRRDGRVVQRVALALLDGRGGDGGPAVVHLRPAEARDLAVRLLEVAHRARGGRAGRGS
jgi:hypothetical protein